MHQHYDISVVRDSAATRGGHRTAAHSAKHSLQQLARYSLSAYPFSVEWLRIRCVAVSPRENQPATSSNQHVPQSPSSSRSSAGGLSSAPPPTAQLFERSPMKQPLPIGVRPGPVPTPASLPMDDSAVPSAAPAASPWSWSTPLGNLADIRPLRPASEQAHPLLQQSSHHELWRNGAATDSSQVWQSPGAGRMCQTPTVQVRAPPGYNLGWGGVNGSTMASASQQALNQNSSFHGWRGATGNTAVPPSHPQYKYPPADNKYPMQYFDS